MRRQDIQLLARAKSGDVAASLEVGRRYLSGIDGFPHHVATGLDYLAGGALRGQVAGAVLVARALELQDILALDQLPSLQKAAAAKESVAMVKLGAWLVAHAPSLAGGLAMLEAAEAIDDQPAVRKAVARLRGSAPSRRADALRALHGEGRLKCEAVASLATREAIKGGDVNRIWDSLDVLWTLAPAVTDDMAEVVIVAIARSEALGAGSIGLEASVVEQCLDHRASRNDPYAALLLGKALCGIDDGVLPPSALVVGTNVRKGAAMLLRSADGGCDTAWVHLHRVHSDQHSSVANAQMARFFLEKAALCGDTLAQRKLGAAILKVSSSVSESEQGMQWLSAAADKGDISAQRLLNSFVLPVEGDPAQAEAAIETLRLEDPLLAWRLRLARDFGLTKLEALCVDPVVGARTWGLVVGPNAFIQQVKLGSPRAIPASSSSALHGLRGAVAFFKQFHSERGQFEGDLRKRSVRLRRALVRRELDEDIFFARANTTTLDALRVGAKWAYRLREPLQSALAA